MTHSEDEAGVKFIVNDSSTTNNSLVFLSRSTLNNQNIWSGVSILLNGKEGRRTAVTVLPDEDDNFAQDEIRMNATVRSKLGVAVGDSVKLGNYDEINYGKMISVRPVDVLRGSSADLNSTHADLQRENLLEAYLWPYFFKAYRPVHQGDTFTVDVTAGGKKIKFEVVETSPSPFCIVAPGTTIKISANSAATSKRPSDSTSVNSPGSGAEAEFVPPPGIKIKLEGGGYSCAKSKRRKTCPLTTSSSRNINKENCTASDNLAGDPNLHSKSTGEHSKTEIRTLAENLGKINGLIEEFKKCFVNPQLSLLQSWSDTFLKLEQDSNDGCGNTAENGFCDLLKDPAPIHLARHLLQTNESTKALRISEIMLDALLEFIGPKSDTLFDWLLEKCISLAALYQPTEALDLLHKFEKEQSQIASNYRQPVLKAKCCIASILKEQDKHWEALAVLRNVHDQQLNSLGQGHPDTLDTGFEMGKCLTQLEIDGEALSMFQSVHEKRRVLLGPGHEDTIAVQVHIANILGKQKRFDEALSAAEEIYGARVDTLGVEHPHTLLMQSYIRKCVDLQKRQREELLVAPNIQNLD